MARDIFEVTPLKTRKTAKKNTGEKEPWISEPPVVESELIHKQFLRNTVSVLKGLKLPKIPIPAYPVWVWAVAVIVGLSIFSLYGGQKNIMGVLTVGFYKNPEKAVQEEIIKLLADVSKLIVLPADEVPIIATVNDPVKLANQAFFTKARAGDKVLIYPNNRRAILYSPKDNKIVEVSPLKIETQN